MKNNSFPVFFKAVFKKYSLLILLLLLLVGIALRLYKLEEYSFSSDEAIIAVNTSGTVIDSISRIKDFISNVPSAVALASYTFIVIIWRQIFGGNDFGLRLLAVVFGAGSIAAIYCLGKILFNSKKAGLFSAFLLTISPLHIYYSQELSAYSLITLLSILSVYFFIRALKEPRLVFWLGYVIFNALNVYIHFMTVFLLLAEISFFIIRRKNYRKEIRKWLASNFIVSAVVIPCLFIVIIASISSAMRMRYSQWVPKPGISSVFFTIKNFSIGYNVPKIVYLFATSIFSALFFYGIFKTKDKEKLSLVLFCLIIPVLAVFLLSQFNMVYLDRFLIPSSVFYYLIIANGLVALNGKRLAVVLLGISFLCVWALGNYYNNYLPVSFAQRGGVFKKNDCRAAANFIINEFKPGDVVFHTCRNTVFPCAYYFSGNAKTVLNDAENSIILLFNKDNVLVPYKYDLVNDKYVAQKNIRIEGSQRAWVVLSHWDFENKLKNNSYSGLQVVNWMDNNYIRKRSREFNGVIVYLYSKY